MSSRARTARTRSRGRPAHRRRSSAEIQAEALARPLSNCSGSANNCTLGFRKPLNSPALRMVTRATQASIQQPSSLESPSPSTDSMPDSRTASSASRSRSRPPKRLSLSLQKPTFGMAGGAPHVGELADRLVQHHRHRGHIGYVGVGVPILGPAWLLEQLDARRVERCGEAAGIGFGIGAVGIEPHGGATADRALDRLDAPESSAGVFADLDLEGAKAFIETPFDLLPRCPSGSELLNGVSSGSRTSRSNFKSG